MNICKHTYSTYVYMSFLFQKIFLIQNFIFLYYCRKWSIVNSAHFTAFFLTPLFTLKRPFQLLDRWISLQLLCAEVAALLWHGDQPPGTPINWNTHSSTAAFTGELNRLTISLPVSLRSQQWFLLVDCGQRCLFTASKEASQCLRRHRQPSITVCSLPAAPSTAALLTL